jgi:hypothetical protein
MSVMKGPSIAPPGKRPMQTLQLGTAVWRSGLIAAQHRPIENGGQYSGI